MIAPEVFAVWIKAFAQRLRSELGAENLTVLYADLSAVLDTASFEVAARRVLRDHVWNSWPAAAEFIKAAPRHLPRPDPEAVAEQRATRRLLASWDATPKPRDETVDAFHATWQATLADCRPDAARAGRTATVTRDESPRPTIDDPAVLARREARRRAEHARRKAAELAAMTAPLDATGDGAARQTPHDPSRSEDTP